MAAELQSAEEATRSADSTKRKRKPKPKPKHGKGKRSRRFESLRGATVTKKPKKPSEKMRRIFKKRAREYHSDSDEEDSEAQEAPGDSDDRMDGEDGSNAGSSEEEGEMGFDDENRDGVSSGDDEDVNGRHEITKLIEGSRAFRAAFMKIMKYHLPNDPLGPILSVHKKLVAEKLAEEELEQKVKGEAKKEKHLAGEKGHVEPASFLDTKEKHLISIATKGVVKLFNAVNRAQNSQKGLNPSRSKDAKVLAKQRKQTFLSEIKKCTTQASGNPSSLSSSKVPRSASTLNDDEPGWAPLRNSYMLTNSKLRDWDKMPDPVAVADVDQMPLERSDDDE